MASLPAIDIVVITYDRVAEISKTITAIEKYLIYPRDKVRYLIADDATPGDYHQRLDALPIFKHIRHEYVPAERNLGWGGNANRALRYSSAEFVYFTEDDYVLRRPLDLRAGVATMMVKPEIGMLRYRGTAGSHVIYHGMEADIKAFSDEFFFQSGVGLEGRIDYLLLDSGSPTLWLYSNGPHLRRKSFVDHYGYYPEGLKLGATEESYAHTVKDAMRDNPYAPVLAILPEWIPLWYDHIGKSFQLTEKDK
jgi:glycosyltransferase involved in cell wall biosynthesis